MSLRGEKTYASLARQHAALRRRIRAIEAHMARLIDSHLTAEERDVRSADWIAMEGGRSDLGSFVDTPATLANAIRLYRSEIEGGAA